MYAVSMGRVISSEETPPHHTKNTQSYHNDITFLSLSLVGTLICLGLTLQVFLKLHFIYFLCETLFHK
jgi:hypothetical protein